MAFMWEDAPGYAVGIQNARATLELKVPFRTDGYGEVHTPVLLDRLQQLGVAKGVKAVAVEEWAGVLLVVDAHSGGLVAVLSLEE
jgi:hypothetical protein